MNGPDFQYDGLTAFAPITSAATAKKKGLMAAADKARLDRVPWAQLLNYQATTDLLNGTALVAGTWLDVGGAQSFTIQHAGSNVLVWVRGSVIGPGAAGGAQVGARALIDGSTGVPLGGGFCAAGTNTNLLAGSSAFSLLGVNAGTHSITIQVVSSLAGAAFCRPATQPNYESLGIVIVEWFA